ncbi:MAG: cohesin domain-containing protein, partial [Pirellula sp.]
MNPIPDRLVLQGFSFTDSYADLTRVFADSDGPSSELTFSVVANSDASLVTTAIAAGKLNLTLDTSRTGTATITIRGTDPVGAFVEDTFVVTVLAPSFHVTGMALENSAIAIQFGDIIDVSVLNLYDGTDAPVDAADVTVIGANTGAVHGSLLWNSATRVLTFLKTGGPLVPDNYSVTVFSRPDGLRLANGVLLDGDNDGLPGGNYLTTFGVTANTARVVSIPDFARGATSTAGQSVNLSYDNGNPGVPVTISDGAGVLAVDFDVVYNPALIHFTSTFFAVLPGGWSTTVNLVSSGRMRLTLSGTTPLAAGPQIITRLLAGIPANAAYGASDLVRIEALAVYTDTGRASPVPSIGDAGLHKAIFVGDTNADGQYTAQDAGWTAGVRVAAYTGFDAYSWTDPSIVADVNQNGSLDGLDSSWIARKGLSNALQPEIPNLPAGSIAVPSGVDPTIAADSQVLARAGQTVQVPIRITDSAIGLWGVDTFVGYNTNLLDVVDGLNSGNVALAGMFVTETGWTLDSFADDATGNIRISAYRATPSTSTQGQFAQVAFTVKSGTPSGEIPLLVNGYSNVPPFTFSFVSGSILVDANPPTVVIPPVTPSPRTTPVPSVD